MHIPILEYRSLRNACCRGEYTYRERVYASTFLNWWLWSSVPTPRGRVARAAVNGSSKGEEVLNDADEKERLRVLEKQTELAERITSGEFTVSKPW